MDENKPFVTPIVQMHIDYNNTLTFVKEKDIQK